MTTRLLATIEGVFCAVPLRDHLSNLITTTQYLVDRNIYAAVLTRQQWDKLREEYWATGRQCDHGRLVPDIDFVASDGKSFLDFEACRKHEAAIAKPLPEENKARVADQINHLEQFEIKTAPDGPPVEIVTEKAPDTLEDRMLVVVGSNYMNLSLVASLLKAEENAVRAVAESSDKFRVSGTGRSICKTDAP